jgi:hypothetical protein
MKPSIFSKNKIITSADIEQYIETEHTCIKKDACLDGKQSGINNQPKVHGDKLIYFIETYKSRYEQVIAKILRIYQPALQLPAGKMESDRAIADKNKMSEEIDKMKGEIRGLEMDHYDPSGLASRIRKALFINIGLFIVDIVLNTQAFETTGDNYIASLLMSASVAFAICLAAHYTGKKYQSAQTRLRRIIVLTIGAVFIASFSLAIASFRAALYRKIGIDINPNSFTVFNIGFFFVAVYTTIFYHPTQEETDENQEHLDRYKKIKQLTKSAEEKEKALKEYTSQSDEKIQGHFQGMVQPEYFIEGVKFMYLESVNEFKRANRLSRKEIPDCFSDPVPPLDIPHVTLGRIINKYKNHDHENNNNSPDHAA